MTLRDRTYIRDRKNLESGEGGAWHGRGSRHSESHVFVRRAWIQPGRRRSLPARAGRPGRVGRRRLERARSSASAGSTFGVVSLGYWRPDVDTYMAELRSWMVERAGERPMNGAAPEACRRAGARLDADEPAAMPSGWAQGIVERLRRVTEASTASTALAEVASEPVPDVVSVCAAPPRGGGRGGDGRSGRRPRLACSGWRSRSACEDAVSMSGRRAGRGDRPRSGR